MAMNHSDKVVSEEKNKIWKNNWEKQTAEVLNAFFPITVSNINLAEYSNCDPLCVVVRRSFPLHGNSVFILFISSKELGNF